MCSIIWFIFVINNLHLCMNNIYTLSEMINFIYFAYDVNLFYLHQDTAALVYTINIELLKYSTYFAVNEISLITNKHISYFSLRQIFFL